MLLILSNNNNLCICDLGYAGEQCEEELGSNAAEAGIYTDNHHNPILTSLIAYENQLWIYNIPVNTFIIILEDGKSNLIIPVKKITLFNVWCLPGVAIYTLGYICLKGTYLGFLLWLPTYF